MGSPPPELHRPHPHPSSHPSYTCAPATMNPFLSVKAQYLLGLGREVLQSSLHLDVLCAPHLPSRPLQGRSPLPSQRPPCTLNQVKPGSVRTTEPWKPQLFPSLTSPPFHGLGLLWISQLCPFRYWYLCEHKFPFLFSIRLGVEWVRLIVDICLTYKKPSNCFPKWLHHFTVPPAVYYSPICSSSSPILGIIRFCCFGFLRERIWAILRGV